jgi:hypothetical protein
MLQALINLILLSYFALLGTAGLARVSWDRIEMKAVS